MSRVAGSMSGAKREAILSAAVDLMSRLGPQVSLGRIAREASVSKQTVYNHFRTKSGLIDALVDSRVSELGDPRLEMDSDASPEDHLTSYALALLQRLSQPAYGRLLRAIFFTIQHDPEAARRIYGATAARAREQIAAYFRSQCAQGRLSVDNPDVAAELFHTAVVSNAQMMLLAGIFDPTNLECHAKACARLFTKAYIPPGNSPCQIVG
ncbi:TetR/AcrR family transcriptional regulator [soil metagenome]